METNSEVQSTLRSLHQMVERMDQRLQRLESGSGFATEESVVAPPSPSPDVREDGLEFEIGERWLGPVGIVVLLVGITIFASYPFGDAFPPGAQILVSYLAAFGMLAVARGWRTSFVFTAHLLLAGGVMLLYLSTLRLHFFQVDPLIANTAVGLAVQLPVVAVGFFAAVRRDVEHLAVLALLMGLVTGLCAEGAFGPTVIVLAAAVLAVIAGPRQWWGAMVAGVVLSSAGLLLWLFNAPVLGRPMQLVTEAPYIVAHLVTLFAVFGVAALKWAQEDLWTTPAFLLAIGNGTALFVFSFLAGDTQFESGVAFAMTVAAAASLVLAALYWIGGQRPLETAIYACFGYMSLSMAIIAQFGSPSCFTWLGWQSLLVISTAIWFRSKIIVACNMFIYLGVLFVYLVMSPPDLATNLSYAAVALLSARVMKWQQERLTLQTDTMRTLYLASTFVIVPYGLYHGVPASYVSLSWVGAAGFYFALSLILQNQKYRWMAILTMLLTVVYVFAIDLGRLSPVFRIVSLLVLGVALLAVSLMYSRHRRAS
ncbi:MAG: hypothetical protein HN712_13205 [Gemmatimonadetes bacterium]|jgi:hypothetical protein|nr:hypothetical protein [Gemmatimonadota bacterium]MBT6148422.1 hypothetical protein [Gemmatimonadota bacterium]MBT7861272.1 hypothetical protein [Gemmatimonadota bacterium]